MIRAKYTIVLETLLSDEKVKPLIDRALSSYPLYNPVNDMTYTLIPTRTELNSKILNHYKYREIGFETIGRFLDELEIAMNEIMPYYNQLYKSADVMNGIDDVFGNVDITETYEEERSDKATGETSSSSTDNTKENSKSNATSSANDKTTTTDETTTHNKGVKVDTPQGMLDITASEIDSLDYATEMNLSKNGTDSKGSSVGESTTENETTSENTGEKLSESGSEMSSESLGTTRHTSTRKGNQGVNTYAHDMKELRETFLNIERQIINDDRIQELFMLIY